MSIDSVLSQPAFPGLCPVEAAAATMASAGVEARGAVFTRREVVDFILDLAGYTDDKPLHQMRLLEPSVGEGDFLLPAVERLLTAYHRDAGPTADIVADLSHCICAIELHHATFEKVSAQLTAFLEASGMTQRQAHTLAKQWLRQGDFLLLPFDKGFTHVVGNPPYVRQELIPDPLLSEYRRRYRTIYDRADIYIPFIERSLTLLVHGGILGFICADRWMKNRYGGPLRRFIGSGYRLRYFVDMVGTSAFLSDVIAYPGIIVVAREPAGPYRVAFRPALDAVHLRELGQAMTARTLPPDAAVIQLPGIAKGDAPWMMEAPEQLDVVRRLESAFPLLEDAGCKVGIGVATGADQVFIAPYDDLNVEADRKLPIAMTRDIDSGTVKWRGYGVINPFGDDGKLVALSAYPRLAAYLEANGAAIKARHVSQKNPARWYRTIDRIYPELTSKPKLLIPDIKGEAHIVYEGGKLYPHHNLYYITSEEWDLRALQAVLMSDVTRTFITLYSTKMRGGYLRFQAQYLRRLRLPRWTKVPHALQTQLARAGKSRDVLACNEATATLYSLTRDEQRNLITGTRLPDGA